MRGPDEQTEHMFSYLSPEQRVPADHPLRAIRALTDDSLRSMSAQFERLYSAMGRPSIPPEQLLRALLLQVLYTVRSERLLMEELEYNLLFRWFVGLNMDDPVWHLTTFARNRDRLLAGEVAATFFDAIGRQARAAGLLSDEHFTVDGTQLEAWASLKSFRPRTGPQGPPPDGPRNPTVDFHGERRRNDTHQSTTDPQARLYRKGSGREATLAYLGHVLLDNGHGLVANVCVTAATGTAERDAAAWMLAASAPPGSTVGADMGYDTARFVDEVRALEVTPAHRAEDPLQRPRRPDHPASRLPGQSTEAEVGPAGLRLAEDGWRTAEAAPSARGARRWDRDLRGGRLQPRANASLGGDVSLVSRAWPAQPDATTSPRAPCSSAAWAAWVNGRRTLPGYPVAARAAQRIPARLVAMSLMPSIAPTSSASC